MGRRLNSFLVLIGWRFSEGEAVRFSEASRARKVAWFATWLMVGFVGSASPHWWHHLIR